MQHGNAADEPPHAPLGERALPGGGSNLAAAGSAGADAGAQQAGRGGREEECVTGRGEERRDMTEAERAAALLQTRQALRGRRGGATLLRADRLASEGATLEP